jgi:hypothetical protein
MAHVDDLVGHRAAGCIGSACGVPGVGIEFAFEFTHPRDGARKFALQPKHAFDACKVEAALRQRLDTTQPSEVDL